MTNPVIAFCTYFLGMLVAYLFFFQTFLDGNTPLQFHWGSVRSFLELEPL